jgi:hypothetical protein
VKTIAKGALLALLLSGCKNPPPPPPPPPTTGTVTLSSIADGNPGAAVCGTAPCISGYLLQCAGQDTVTLGPGVTEYTVTLPTGPASCTMEDTVNAPGLNVVILTASWSGTVTASGTSVALKWYPKQ